ncbi:heterogeneous nuclear ribonucleoprotein R [Prunus yedoensis var. nudiflora]|uniref:Heterogeneous nuclear ribonucleoprotein R n=1 Tax=Prunus yedoensis var. nudiflora TaxID=2094558 RepID=A0A314XG94_PRUYE|nr:heterogeneous nuclear ribonucleoprotein R [Prunus yedoensis var. nudiflora]
MFYSQAKHRLFIGNVPRNWGEEDMKKAVTDIGPGVISVELLKVKAVYVKNLPKDITQESLKELFERHGKITKVVLPPAKAGHEKSRFGFVHFAERACAMKALKNTEKYEIDGQVLECSLAKPQADQKSSGSSNHQKSPLLPTYPPRLSYGMGGSSPYGGLSAGYGGGAGFAQPLIYGRGPTPAGMAMMPMLLPDGRIGYVLQQPGMQPHTPPPPSRGGRSGGGSSSGGRRSGDNNRGRSRYNPY